MRTSLRNPSLSLCGRLTQELIAIRQSIMTQTGTKGAAYVVYNNSVARDVARALPVSASQLREVKGFGVQKAQQYGPFIFAKVRALFVSRALTLSCDHDSIASHDS